MARSVMVLGRTTSRPGPSPEAAVGAVIAAWISADGHLNPDHLAFMDLALEQLEGGRL